MKRFRLLFLSLIPLFLFSCGGKKVEHSTGLLIDADAYEKIPRKARLVSREYEDLPSAVDLREYLPVTGDQGQYGTCVAWSTTYCAMTATDSIGLGRVGRQVAANNAFSPYFLYRNCNPEDSTARIGMYEEDALWFMKYEGVPKRIFEETQIEFKDYEMNLYDGEYLYKIGDYATLFSYYEEDPNVKIQAVRKSLSQKKPVVIGFEGYPSSFYSYDGDRWYPRRWEMDGDSGHSMVIVAYDDDNYGGSFLFQNSWGPEWGDNGCKWVAYEDFAKYTVAAYEMSSVRFAAERYWSGQEPEPQPEPQPEPEPEPVITTIYQGSFSIPMAYRDRTIEVELDDDVYYAKDTFSFTDRFRLELTNTKPCYVYVFSSDETTGKATRLFPDRNTSALLDYSSNTIALPAENKWIEFDSVEGTDYLIVLYSLDELNLDDIMSSYEMAVRNGLTGKHNLKDRVQLALDLVECEIMDDSRIDFSRNSVKFEGWVEDDENAGILPVLLVFDHE